jgi:preprotein translocase subunit SecD
MNRRIRTRLVVTFLLTVLSIYLFAGFPPSLSTVKQRIHLGLDLKGGILLQLQVVTEDAVRAETDLAIEKVRTLLQKENIVTIAISRTSTDAFALKAVDSAKGDELRKGDRRQSSPTRLLPSRDEIWSSAGYKDSGRRSGDQHRPKSHRPVGCQRARHSETRWRRR